MSDRVAAIRPPHPPIHGYLQAHMSCLTYMYEVPRRRVMSNTAQR